MANGARRQRVGIVGAGRAGLSLAIALVADGRTSVDVVLGVRDPERAERIGHWLDMAGLGGVRIDAAPTPRSAAASAWAELDVIVFAVPDRAIDQAVATLVAADALSPACCLLHLSGAAPVEALAAGAPRPMAALHPLAALRDPLRVDPGPGAVAEVVGTLRGATFGLAGDDRALDLAVTWLDAWHSPRVRLAAEGRVLWHAAAALVANDLVALLALGEALAEAAGVATELARPAQLHLARSALDAVGAEAPGSAPIWHGLTGAVRRGDAETLARHLAAMVDARADRAAAQHRSLSAVLVELLARDGALPTERIEAMRAATSVRATTPATASTAAEPDER